MLEFLKWLVVGALIMYPLYFAMAYALAKLGVLPKAWVAKDMPEEHFSVIIEPVGSATFVKVEARQAASNSGFAVAA